MAIDLDGSSAVSLLKGRDCSVDETLTCQSAQYFLVSMESQRDTLSRMADLLEQEPEKVWPCAVDVMRAVCTTMGMERRDFAGLLESHMKLLFEKHSLGEPTLAGVDEGSLPVM